MRAKIWTHHRLWWDKRETWRVGGGDERVALSRSI